jgi:hypothetical protein
MREEMEEKVKKVEAETKAKMKEMEAETKAKREEMEGNAKRFEAETRAEAAEARAEARAEAADAKAEAREAKTETRNIAGTVSKLMTKTFIPLVDAICSRCLVRELGGTQPRQRHRHRLGGRGRPCPCGYRRVCPQLHKTMVESIQHCDDKFAEIHMPSKALMADWGEKVSYCFYFSIIHSSLSSSSPVVACFRQ